MDDGHDAAARVLDSESNHADEYGGGDTCECWNVFSKDCGTLL